MSYVIQELCDEIGKLKQALAEKDREITHLQDVYMKQRHKHDGDYQQLMEKSVGLAKILMGASSEAFQYMTGEQFLKSPEVQAWKEHQS